ncbi:ribonuclease H-like domain-containing protein [Lenzites betulinus]|nr:ribonuclease H-like domain-containing protein [Lenzites betulinus]
MGNGTAAAVAGAGVWFGPDDPRNIAERVPGECRSNQAGEAYACLLAAGAVPNFAPLTITTDSMYLYKGLTVHLGGWENRGWAEMANADILKALVAKLRGRSAPTYLKWVKGHSGVPGNDGADRLAAEGSQKTPTDFPSVSERERAFLIDGARLATLTQKFAYRRIVQGAVTAPRTRSEINAQMIQAALGDDLAVHHTKGRIWANVWGKDMSVKISCFFWKAMHDAYRVGGFWNNIRGYEQRAYCTHCRVEESMGHILLDCEAPGQGHLWNLAGELLEKAGVPMPPPSLGMILGIPSLESLEANTQIRAGRTRLMKIILSETAYLIWKVRCERVIEWSEEVGRTHSNRELQRRWVATINARLHMDVQRTRKQWKARRLPVETVLNTWKGTLLDEAALPDDWTGTAGVLVGMLLDGDRHRTG